MRRSRVAITVALLTAATAGVASAQSAASRPDVAVQATFLRLNDLDATSTGIGGRVTAGLSRWIAVDGEINFYPHDDFTLAFNGGLIDSTAGLTYLRKRTDGFAGVKIGRQGDRIGVFAKARPGFTRLTNQGIRCDGDVCALILLAVPDYKTEFAFDVGGIVEFYPSARTIARVDVGDVMIRHRGFAPPCTGCTTHNFTTKIGVGVKF